MGYTLMGANDILAIPTDQLERDNIKPLAVPVGASVSEPQAQNGPAV